MTDPLPGGQGCGTGTRGRAGLEHWAGALTQGAPGVPSARLGHTALLPTTDIPGAGTAPAGQD